MSVWGALLRPASCALRAPAVQRLGPHEVPSEVSKAPHPAKLHHLSLRAGSLRT